MKFLKNLFTVLLLFFTVSASADELATLVVELRDGSTATVDLSEKPTITFTAGMLKVVSERTLLEFVRADVKKYHFSHKDVNSVEEISLSQQVIIEGNTVMISGIADGTAVAVYTTSGTVVCSTVSARGRCVLSLSSLPCGLYIVTYNNTTIKFLKR